MKKIVAAICIAATTMFGMLFAYCVINFVSLPTPEPVANNADEQSKNLVYLHNRDVQNEAFGLTVIAVPSLAFAMFFGVISFGVYPSKKEPATT